VTKAPDIELAIEARGLTRRFGDVTAVDALDLSIPRGQLFGLVGPDGAGKSTLIRMLATVIKPTDGDALVFGSSVRDDARAIKPRLGYMSQRFSLYPDLTVAENLDFFAELRGVRGREKTDRAKRLLEFAGLTEFASRRAEYLSGGMKQKLALAATLIHEPDLIFLDEPTTGVDPVSRREFWRIISDLHRRGITVFVATPYMDEAERCAQVAYMADGRIVVSDTPAGLKARVPGRLIEVAASDLRRAMPVLQRVTGVTSVELHGDVVWVLGECGGPCDEAVREALAADGITVEWIREAPITMETAFSTLVRGDLEPVGSSRDSDPSGGPS
jgi:ABC-2 type transport system ATP-binding protein